MSSKKHFITLFAATLLLHAFSDAFARESQSGMQAAREVLTRTIGPRASSFHLELLAAKDSIDTYELSASGGIVHVKGSSPITLTRGAYDYLRAECGVMITWSSGPAVLPEKFPDCPPRKVSSPYAYRQHFNVCTFGYTTVWWDWKRWERELDWMALHGVNMPLAMVGQEAVWQKVWASFGIPASSLDDFFTGPAFLPWQRMGNVNKHGGPLSQEWIDGQSALQQKILQRARALGMEPIVPAFSGFVPRAFAKSRPQEKLIENSNWGSFPGGYQTYVLPPNSPSFTEIGRRFILEYRKTYGPTRYYLADTFNELDVPVSAAHRYDELASYGKAVFESINAGDPHGIWVMQGWLFANSPSFWDKPSTRALLSKVPDDRMLILDLANEFFHGWKKYDAFYGKKWIYSIIHNFGGNNPLHGDLPFIARDPAKMLADSGRGGLSGFGMAPEGTENNEVVYELLTDMAWRSEPVDLQDWLSRYAHSRYGSTNPTLDRGWLLLKDALYSKTSMNFRHALQVRPSLRIEADSRGDRRVRQALDIFLAQPPPVSDNRLFRRDVIELASYYFGTVIDRKLHDALEAYRAGDVALSALLKDDAITVMKRLDGILESYEDLRLSTWTGQARSFGSTPAAKKLLEENARTQVTVWGGSELHDYAAKMWSGLLRDFYAPRWEYFFGRLLGGAPADTLERELAAWDNAWCAKENLSPAGPVGDPVKEIRSLLTALPTMTKVAPTPSIAVSKKMFFAGDSSLVTMTAEEPGFEIRLTTDGSLPTEESALYGGPFFQKSSAHITARAFAHGVHPGGAASVLIQMPDSANGLTYTYYEERVSSLSDSALAGLPITGSGRAYDFDVRNIARRDDDYVIVYDGQISVTVPGLYRFSTESDDGSRLLIDGTLVVDNDGAHAMTEKSGSIGLTAGRHRFTLRFFQASGAAGLRVWLAGPGKARQELPVRMLFPSSHHD